MIFIFKINSYVKFFILFYLGGVGDAVCSAVSEEKNITVKKLAVQEVPRSGKCAELLDRYGISSSCIVKAVTLMLTQ